MQSVQELEIDFDNFEDRFSAAPEDHYNHIIGQWNYLSKYVDENYHRIEKHLPIEAKPQWELLYHRIKALDPLISQEWAVRKLLDLEHTFHTIETITVPITPGPAEQHPLTWWQLIRILFSFGRIKAVRAE